MNDAYDVLNFINAIYSGAIIIIGTLSNLACIFICLRPALRKIPTFIFYSFSLFSDIFTLYVWNVDHILITFAQTQLEFMGIEMCKFVTFVQLFSMQNSAWILVLMTIERYLSTRLVTWRTQIFNPTKALFICIFISVTLALMNASFALALEYVFINTYNNTVPCFGEPVYYLWMQEHIYMYSVIPAFLITCFNLLLIFQFKNMSKMKKTKDQSSQMKTNFSIMLTSTLFTILTFPNSISNGFYAAFLLSTKPGTTILFFLDTVAFSFHAWNFIALYLTNKSFKKEFESVFKLNRIRVFKSKIDITTVL